MYGSHFRENGPLPSARGLQLSQYRAEILEDLQLKRLLIDVLGNQFHFGRVCGPIHGANMGR